MSEQTKKQANRPRGDDLAARVQTLTRQVEMLTELGAAGYRLSYILHSDALFNVFAEIVGEKLGIDRMGIYVHEKRERALHLEYNRGCESLPAVMTLDDHDVFNWMIARGMITREAVARSRDVKAFFSEKLPDWQAVGTWIPLAMQRELIGLVAIAQAPGELSGDRYDRQFLEKICAHTAVCLHTCLLYEKRNQEKEDLDKTLYNLSLLYDIGRAMTHISDLKSLLKYILNQAIAVTRAEKGSIMLHDPDTNQLSIRVLAGLEDKVYQERVNNNEIKCRSFLPGEGVAGKVFATGKPVFINKTGEDNAFVESKSSYTRSIVCIPMHVYNETIGVINVTNKKDERGFNQEDVAMLSAVADQAAVSISKAQLWEMAVMDSLTGLHVRRYFMVRLQEEIHRTERYEKTLSVIMADLDRFKKVNDTFGHTAGDEVLKAVGEYLKRSIRDVDSVGRYGGEEFVLLLPETDKAAASLLAERLRKGVAAMDMGRLPGITISMGIATFPEDGRTVDGLVQKADAALYAAKKRGRNRVVAYAQDVPLPLV